MWSCVATNIKQIPYEKVYLPVFINGRIVFIMNGHHKVVPFPVLIDYGVTECQQQNK